MFSSLLFSESTVLVVMEMANGNDAMIKLHNLTLGWILKTDIMGKRAAGFIIFRKISSNFEYLLLQASYGTHHWTPPKGHVDPGESDLDTAFRETREEAGFEKDDLKVVEGFKKVLKYSVNGEPKTVIYWLAELCKSTPVVLSSEHQAYKWGTLNIACELSGYKDFQDMLQECEQYISHNYNK